MGNEKIFSSKLIAEWLETWMSAQKPDLNSEPDSEFKNQKYGILKITTELFEKVTSHSILENKRHYLYFLIKPIKNLLLVLVIVLSIFYLFIRIVL